MLYLYVASQNIQPFSLHSLFSVALMIWCACKNKQCSVWLWCSVSQLCTTCVLRMEHRGMWSSCFTVFHGGFIHDVQPDAGGSVGSSYCHQCKVILQPLRMFLSFSLQQFCSHTFYFQCRFYFKLDIPKHAHSHSTRGSCFFIIAPVLHVHTCRWETSTIQ